MNLERVSCNIINVFKLNFPDWRFAEIKVMLIASSNPSYNPLQKRRLARVRVLTFYSLVQSVHIKKGEKAYD